MFAKIFEQIYDSSIAENFQTRHVFMDMLVLADSDGVVDMTLSAIARRTNVPTEIVRKAVEELEAPDKESRTREHEGRRLLPLAPGRGWGWRIVNYLHYRKLQTEEARRDYFREYKRAARAASKPSKNVHSVHNGPQGSTKAEAEEDAEAEAKQPALPLPPSPPPPAPRGNTPSSKEAKLLARLFHREETDKWSSSEVTAFKARWPFDFPTLQLVARYTQEERKKGDSGKDRGIHKRSLLALLNEFQTEVDRAREWAKRNPQTAAKIIKPAQGATPPPEPPGFRAWFGQKYPKAEPDHPWEAIPDDIKADYAKAISGDGNTTLKDAIP